MNAIIAQDNDAGLALDAHALRATPDLNVLMDSADPSDLDIMVDYITDRGQGRLTLDSTVCSILVKAKEGQHYGPTERALIAHEVLEFGGNTLGNAYRKARAAIPAGGLLDSILPNAAATVEYDEIVRDVASHLDVKLPGYTAVADVEEAILRRILGRAVEKMTDDERAEVEKVLGFGSKPMGPAALAAVIQGARLGGFATYKLATMVAHAVSKALLGRGLTFATTGALMKGLSVALGPIGWAVTALWTLADLSSPAYRVTVPAVVQIAYMRSKLIAQHTYRSCKSCDAAIERTDKFCSECGTAQEA
ncbi:YaaW family protein [Lysobacter auxotrophicus]|uniref:Zinc-ribbon domain-containing protein n=1 Tax=Lysobacter auxotrophicus TaxID=2992573 RepID=A0ABN6UQE1_9GAMM|nr:ubiquinol-cytochrome C chaperone family protein [Lysobacter auxotrophicus]BDU18120.1 zinc-ribbon domain-containing protein [Lysobacter auxotrophicus]